MPYGGVKLTRYVKLTIPQNYIRKYKDGSNIWSGLIDIDGENHIMTMDMSGGKETVRFQGPVYHGEFPIKELKEYKDDGLKHKKGDYYLVFEYEEPDLRENIYKMAKKAEKDRNQTTPF